MRRQRRNPISRICNISCSQWDRTFVDFGCRGFVAFRRRIDDEPIDFQRRQHTVMIVVPGAEAVGDDRRKLDLGRIGQL